MAGRALKIDPSRTVTKQPEVQHDMAQTSDEDAIAARAYECWQERGCPIGSDQEDWFKAENEVKGQKAPAAA
jgi:hypothetical protein